MPLPLNSFRNGHKKDAKTPANQPTVDIGTAMGPYDNQSVRERVRQWQAQGGGVVVTTDMAFEPDNNGPKARKADITRNSRRRASHHSPAKPTTPPKQVNNATPNTSDTHKRRNRRDGIEQAAAQQRPRSISAPRKRVVSDENWRADRGVRDGRDRVMKHKSRPSWALPDDGIRVRPIGDDNEPYRRNQQNSPMQKHRKELFDDGIRVYGMDTVVNDQPGDTTSPCELQTVDMSLDEAHDEDNLSFHSPTPSERDMAGTRYSCNDSIEDKLTSIKPRHGNFDAQGSLTRNEAVRKPGVRFAPPPKPEKRSGKRLSKSGILNNVIEESKKIFARPEPAPVPGPSMPTIESWLNETPDPFVDGPTFGPAAKSPPPSEFGLKLGTESSLDDVSLVEGIGNPTSNPRRVHDDPNRIWEALDSPLANSRKYAIRKKDRHHVPGTRDSRDDEDEPNILHKRGLEGETTGLDKITDHSSVSTSSLQRRGANRRSSSPTKSDGKAQGSAGTAFQAVGSGKSPDLAKTKTRHAYKPEVMRKPIRRQEATGQTRIKTDSDPSVTPSQSGNSVPTTKTFQHSSSQSFTGGVLNLDTSPELRSHVDQSGLTRQTSRSKITKHTDLMSLLSQPRVGNSKSLRSACSVRSTKNSRKPPKLTEIMSQLAADESKYMRELQTLVDGVIPVLLSSILSKSEAATTIGLFSKKKAKDDPSITKPIYDMGIALERLKRAHKRISLDRAESFLAWAKNTQYIYWDYLQAWRMGFQDVVVNLAPAEPSVVDGTEKKAVDSEGLERNETGDVVNSEGERVDVAFLLKRPLIRIRQMSKSIASLKLILGGADAEEMNRKYLALVDEARNRVSEERARLEDESAAAIDASRARDPQTLALLDKVIIDDALHVRARDSFNLNMHHTSCQVIDCRAELLLREGQKASKSPGDILICEVDGTGRWLLFPPISTSNVSARNGEAKGEIVVLIRGNQNDGREWQELLSLHSDEEETGFEWVQMLGLIPIPPAVQRSRSFLDRREITKRPATSCNSEPLSSVISAGSISGVTSPGRDLVDVPFGENAESRLSGKRQQDSGRRSLQKEDVATKASKRTLRNDLKEPLILQSDSDAASSPRTTVSPRTTESLPLTPPKAGQRHQSSVQDNTRSPGLRKPVPSASPTQSPSTAVEEHSNSSSPKSPDPKAAKDRQSPVSSETYTPPKQPSLVGLQTPDLGPSSASKFKSRPSSPLKNEYEPSTASESSGSDKSSIQQDLSSASDSEDADLEDGDIAMPLLPPGALNRLKSAPGLNNQHFSSRGTIAPSESASQAPYKSVPAQPEQGTKTIASIFFWSDKGCWESMHPDECSVVVTPGLIEAFEMSPLHSKIAPGTKISEKGSTSEQPWSGIQKPLIGLELTPLVPIRRGTALDISVRSPPTPESKMQNIKNTNVMFRSRNPEECEALYALINHARINNPTYIALQNARATSFAQPFGGASFEDSKGGSRGSWFGFGAGSRSGYRASSAPTPSAARKSESSTGSTISAFSAFRRFGLRSTRFSIARSTVTSRRGGSRENSSVFSSSEQSSTSGTSTPLPASIANAMGTVDGAADSGAAPIGLSNAKIRLYVRETASKWRDLGAAQLTIMRPTETLNSGVNNDDASSSATPTPNDTPLPTSSASRANTTTGEPALRTPGSGQPSASDKRVLVTSKKSGERLLDVTLGESCFERVARTGIAVSMWETLHADGQVGKQGGVIGGKFRVYMMQMQSEAEAAYTFGIVGRFRY